MRASYLIASLCMSACGLAGTNALAQHAYSSSLNIIPEGIVGAARSVQGGYSSTASGFSPVMDGRVDYQTGPIPTPTGVLASHSGTLQTEADVPNGAFHTFNSTEPLPFGVGDIFADSTTVFRDQLSFEAGATGAQVHVLLTSEGTLGSVVDPRQSSDVSGYEAQIQLATVVGHRLSGLPIFVNESSHIEDTCGRAGCFAQFDNLFDQQGPWSATVTQGILSGGADVIDVTLSLSPGTSTFDLHVVTQSFVRGSTVNFSDTTRLSIMAPPGVAYSSESGLLLTSVTTPVPEPASTWMLLSGLFAMTVFRRRPSF